MSFDDLMKKYGVQEHSSDTSPTPPPQRRPHSVQGNAVTPSPARPPQRQPSANRSWPSSVSADPTHPHTDDNTTPARRTPSSSFFMSSGAGNTSHQRHDDAWNNAGSFGSNDHISHHEDGFHFSVRPHRTGSGRLRQWPWTDIIFIVLILLETAALLIHLDALFYAILPFVSNLLLLLIIGGAVVLALYFRFGRRGRRW